MAITPITAQDRIPVESFSRKTPASSNAMAATAMKISGIAGARNAGMRDASMGLPQPGKQLTAERSDLGGIILERGVIAGDQLGHRLVHHRQESHGVDAHPHHHGDDWYQHGDL